MVLNMRYEKIVEAKFIERENRFVARVILGSGEICKVHVKNTGRCRELLVPESKVYLEDFEGRMGSRKMRYSLIAVDKETEQGTTLINMDSQAPNKVVQEALDEGRIDLPGIEGMLTQIRPETKFGNSRFDFYIAADGSDAEADGGAAETCNDATKENKMQQAYIEVKGVTLEAGGHARFPDAPTLRGVKHIHELIDAHDKGYGAYIIFVVQMEGMKDVSPNYETHPKFGQALAEAEEAGVNILAYDCKVMPDSLKLNKQIPFHLKKGTVIT